MATWARTSREVECYRSKCGVTIPRGELVCLVSTAKVPACRRCAFKEFGYEPPADLPALPSPRPALKSPQPSLQLSDSVEPPESAPGWARYDRRATIKKLLSVRQLKAANAIDPKLRQLGGDR